MSLAQHPGCPLLSSSISQMKKKPNKTLLCTHHPYPTSAKILQDLNGSKVFSKINLKECYHQIKLAESSHHLTTFKTRVGLGRYKRLPYGASVGSKACQHVIGQVLDKSPRATPYSQSSQVFIWCHRTSLLWISHVNTRSTPDKDRVQAIKQMQPPTNVTEERTFLGRINTVACFVPNLVSMTEPIRRLTHKTSAWLWSPA